MKPGDHVITCLSAFCGHCEFCLTGHLCSASTPETKRRQDEEPRLTLGKGPMMQYLNLSSFAEQMLVHEHALRGDPRGHAARPRRPDRLRRDDRRGAVIHTSQRPRRATTVAVIGCGGVGLAAINGAAIAGAGRIIAIDMAPGQGELAKAFGATDFICAKDTDPVKRGHRDDQGRRPALLRGDRPASTAEQASTCCAAAARPT